MPSAVFVRHCNKEEKIDSFLKSIRTDGWGFQSSIDEKARTHLENLLLDFWPREHERMKRLGNMQGSLSEPKNDNSSSPKIEAIHDLSSIDSDLQEELDKTVNKSYEEIFKEYFRFIYITRQKDVNHNDNTLEDKAASILLLLMIYGQVDVSRMQNHISLILYHAAKMKLSENNLNSATQSPEEGSSNQEANVVETMLPSTVINIHRVNLSADIERSELKPSQLQAEDDKNEVIRRTIILQEPPTLSGDNTLNAATEVAPTNDQVGPFITKQAKYLYKFMNTVINKNLRNEEYFDWDDVNDLCWTPGFVEDYIFQKVDDEKIFDPSFARVFQLHRPEFKHIKDIVDGCGYRGKDKAIQEQIAKSKSDFAKMWKTYFDRAGGVLGWRGYLTLQLHFAEITYFQVFSLVICLFWFVQFRLDNLLYLGLTMSPFGLSLTVFVVKHLLYNRVAASPQNPYRREIPRRDARKQGFISSRVRKYRSWRQLMNTFFLFALFLFYLLGGRYLLLETVIGSTNEFEYLFYSTIQSNYTPLQLVEMLLNMFSLAILWAMILSVFWILPPIFLNVWVGVFGFIQGCFLGVSRVKSWKAFVRKFHHETTIFVHFRAKILAQDIEDHLTLSEKEKERIEWSWALLWNNIVQDFYDGHMLSDKERQNYSYIIKTGPDHGYRIIKRPNLEQEPKCDLCAYHMMRFMNNLWMASMPRGTSVNILDMKRLVIFTPVYKEKILYSWEELVKPGNTNMSFLRHLLIKYPHDWHCFKEKEFPVGNRLRHTVDYLEEKVMAGVDITTHHIHKSTTTEFMKELICTWASLRFQPVARTVKGFMRVPKALALLLRIQNPDMTDEEIKLITRQKFGYIVGAQVYEREMWLGTVSGFSNLSDDAKAACEQEFKEYTSGLNRLTKLGDTMMKIAFLNQDKEQRWWSNLITWDDKKKGFDQLYRLESFGNFSSLGQGKPANQAFMCQFFDGSYVQAIDCNMDSTLCQSFFVPNVLMEFTQDPTVKIVGCPEFLFTYAWSQAAFASAFTERVFGTIVQRVYSILNQRMHYGHPDYIHGLNMMFTTGMSKMNYVSEDIFTGFDNLLNGGRSILADYIEVGKARDVCMLSTSKFNRKISGGAAQLSCARFPNWILTSRHLTFTDKVLYCYTVISFYQNTLFTVVSTLILYVTRILVLLLQLILGYIAMNDRSALLLNINGNLQISILQVTNSLFIIQLSALLSVTGFLQNMLDKGVIKGMIDYFQHAIVLVIYGMFHLMNICYYFHYGFSQSAKYIASGRVTGLEHVTIVGIYKTFKTTHFLTAGFFIFLQFVALAIGGSYQFLLYNTILCIVLIWGPFLFNAGSFPVYCSYDSWKRLYAENLHIIKTWFFEQCKIDEVEKRIKNDKRFKQIMMEYDYKIDKDDMLSALELDLELCVIDSDSNDDEQVMKEQDENYFSKKNRDRAYSISKRENDINARRIKLEQRREKLLKEKIMEELSRKEFMTRRRSMSTLLFSKSTITRMLRKTAQAISKIPMVIEQSFLLSVLVGLKWVSYIILIWKIIVPWASAPNYEVVYVDIYEDKNIDDRLINIQRLLKILFMKRYTSMEKTEIGVMTKWTPKSLAHMGISATTDNRSMETQTAPLPKSSIIQRRLFSNNLSPIQYNRMRPSDSITTPLTRQHLDLLQYISPTISQEQCKQESNTDNLEMNEEIQQLPPTNEDISPIIEMKDKYPKTLNLLMQFSQAVQDAGKRQKTGHDDSLDNVLQSLFKNVMDSLTNDMGLTPSQIRELCGKAFNDDLFDGCTDADQLSHLRRALVMLDLYYYLKLFQKKTNFALVKTSEVINPPSDESSLSRSTFSKKQKEKVRLERAERSEEFKIAAKRLLNVCNFMFIKYNVPFELIMFDPDHPERDFLRERVHQLCRTIVEMIFQLSFSFLIEAKRQFRHFNTYVQQIDIYGNNYSTKCYHCEVKRKRLLVVRKAMATLRQSLNFVERLVEIDPNNKVLMHSGGLNSLMDTSQEYEQDDDDVIDEKEMKIVDNDNGRGFLDQCFPVHETYEILAEMREQYSQPRDNCFNEQDEKMCNPWDDEPSPEEVPRIKRLWKPYYQFLKLDFNKQVAAQVHMEKEAMMEDLLELLRDLMSQPFIDLANDCAEMLAYLKKQEKVIKQSHVHKKLNSAQSNRTNSSYQYPVSSSNSSRQTKSRK